MSEAPTCYQHDEASNHNLIMRGSRLWLTPFYTLGPSFG